MAHGFASTTLAQPAASPTRGSDARRAVVQLIDGLRARLALARTRRIVLALDAAQLDDAGIDVSAILPPRPTIVVDAGLMRRLMTMP